jgi:hypothetical protein
VNLKLAVTGLGVQPENQAYYPQNSRGNEKHLGGDLLPLRLFQRRFSFRIRTELPDFILPYKHYEAPAIQKTLDNESDNEVG